jgi:uncharacterized protein (DUF58 family)
MSGKAVPEGIRITKVGLWYVVIALVVGFAGANTGNNALQLVESLLLAVLVVSGISSRRNVRKLDFHMNPPREIYVDQAQSLRVLVKNLDRWIPRRLLVVRCPGQSTPLLVPSLDRSTNMSMRLDVKFARRGKVSIPHVHVASIFPLGIFHKGQRYPVGLNFLVLPKIQPVTSLQLSSWRIGDGSASLTLGRGHELLSLRDFRAGDEQRSVHWKRTAQTGSMIVIEREAERDQRLTVVLDNGVGKPVSEEDHDRFERLVSNAATAAFHYLERGYEIELLTRGGSIPFGRGRAHRLRVMEYLALIEPTEMSERPLDVFSHRAPTIKMKDLAGEIMTT